MNKCSRANKLSSNGLIELNVSSGRYNLYQESPLYVNIIKDKDYIEAYPVDQSGGLRGGDNHIYKISLDNDSTLKWIPPASTICYPSMHGKDDYCSINTIINIRNNSTLILINKPLIPCKDSIVRQEVEINIDSTSSLFYFDIISVGRDAYNERWDFLSFINKISLHINNKTILNENWELRRCNIPLSKAGFGYNLMYATGIAFNDNSIAKMNNLKKFLDYNGLTISIGELFDKCYIMKALDKNGIILNKLLQTVLPILCPS